MSFKTREAVKYLVEAYPYEEHLTLTRAMFLAYLIDWECTLSTRAPLTDLRWSHAQYGPQALDMVGVIEKEGLVGL